MTDHHVNVSTHCAQALIHLLPHGGPGGTFADEALVPGIHLVIQVGASHLLEGQQAAVLLHPHTNEVIAVLHGQDGAQIVNAFTVLGALAATMRGSPAAKKAADEYNISIGRAIHVDVDDNIERADDQARAIAGEAIGFVESLTRKP